MSEYILERNYDTKNGTFSTVKREEIVRCRDCKHLHRNDPWWECHRAGFYVGTVDGSEPDGFCAWGKVRVGSSRFE